MFDQGDAVLSGATESLTLALDALAAADPHDLPDGVLVEDTETLLKARRILDGVLARRMQVMDARDVTTSYFAMSTRSWLVNDQRLSRGEAGALMAIARSSVTRPAITEAMLAGDINHDHAKTIVAFLPKLPDPDARDHAEKLLLEAANDTDLGFPANRGNPMSAPSRNATPTPSSNSPASP